MDEGGFYTRRPEIEASIDEALAQSPERVLRRAAIRNVRDTNYMPMECLLHLMREARLKKDKSSESKLYLLFMSRCEARLKRAIPDGSRTDAADLRDEVMFKFNVMFARVGTNEDATALDYYEVNFNQAFRFLWWKQVRKDNARKKIFVDIGQEKDEDGRQLDMENTLAKLSEAARNPAQQDNYVYLGQVGKFLATLSPADQETVRLVLVEGYKIKSDDPDEVTAAKILGVGRRAINKRLAKVAAALRKFQQES
ncbi:hypothetical protein V4R08_17635 (plasmid) [Nitrobacter sp. NHB1]|uniref:hypothetical protein n=1 Tax=Nitrobacter sp. NHB1 TaxID=3119830 RepID=UPI002FFED79F